MSQELMIITSHRVGETLGGVEKFVALFSFWCTRRGVRVTVISRTLSAMPVRVTNGLAFKSKDGEIKVVKKVQLPFLLFYIGLMAFSFMALVTLIKLIKSSRLHGNTILALHSQDVNFAAIPTVLAGKIFKLPSVLHQHGPYNELLTSKHMQIIEKSINMIVCRLADIIIVTDRHTRDYIENVVLNGEKLCVIPAAVDLQCFVDAGYSNNSDAHGPFKVGYIGRLSVEKNLEILLFAFKELVSSVNTCCRLIIVGDGNSKEKLQQLALHLGISRDVEFTGFQMDVLPFLSTFDVFVLPSTVEGTPISLIEAMAMGKAVICSNIPSLSEIVDEEVGLLFEPHNSKQLANAMLNLYNSPTLRKKLGKNAKRKACQYDANVIFSKILKSYPKKLHAF